MTMPDERPTARPFQLPTSHPHMNIGDAQSVYRKYGDDLEEFYVSVYHALIADKTAVELPNSNYLHALQLTSLMLRNTAKRFRMLGGSTTDSFVSMLFDDFRRMLTRLRELGGQAQIIVLNADARESLTKLSAEFKNTLKITFGQVLREEKIGHFIVADNMVRIEEPHVKLTAETPANAVKARVVFNSQSQAGQYGEQFDAIWGLLVSAVRK